MKVDFIGEYLEFLNTLNIMFENDNMCFKVTRKNIIFSKDQFGTVIEKHHISLVIDTIDTPFAVVYVDANGEAMRIKYDHILLDEILMCLGGTFTEFHELYEDDIHLHVNKFEKPYFNEMIQRLIVEQKRKSIVKTLYGLSAREVGKTVIQYCPTWAKSRYANTPKQAPKTLKAMREVIADLYDSPTARRVTLKIAKRRSSVYGYEIFRFADYYNRANYFGE